MVPAKTIAMVSCFLVLAVGAAADVQWLRYRTSAQVGEEVGVSVSRPYRRFESAPPKEVRFPKFKSDNPLFLKWQTPMEERGFRWIALDRSTSHGLHNLLYIDSNGDGHLDDETPYQGRIQDQYRAGFDPIAVFFKGEDGPITYHLSCEFFSYDNRSTYLAIAAGCYYEGTVLIDGQAVGCVLLDYNGNGVFGEASDNFNSDRVLLGNEPNRQVFHAGRYLEYKDALYRLEIAPDGAFAGMTAAPDVAYGTVNVPQNLTKFAAGGMNGFYEKTPKDGQVRLPEGQYRVNRWEIARKDKEQNWVLSGSGFPREQSFEVKADLPLTMDVGEPVFSHVSVSERGGTYNVNHQFLGKQGERISLTQNGRRPNAPRVRIRSQNGDYDRTFSLEYG